MSGDGTARTLRFGVFELDLDSGELRRKGVKVRLQEQPFRVLRRLLLTPGEVVTREQLRQELWAGDTHVDFDHSLNEAVNKLRAALDDAADNPRFVETLPRRGYRFVAPLLPSAPADSRAAGPARRQPRALALAALLALAAGWAAWRAVPREAPDLEPIRSLAVLPLANLSGDPGQEHLADGMTDALIAELAGIRALRVISRTSVMRFKGRTLGLPEVARVLGVDAVVEGSLVRAGGRVRITAQLIRAASDEHLWAASYERDAEDILALQGEVAREIAREIQVELTPEEKARLGRPASANPAAYEAYLEGRFHWNKRDEASLRKAIDCFQQAVELDPRFAPAQAGLADAWSALGVYNYIPQPEAVPRAKQAALRALALDDRAPEPHLSLGWALFTFDWEFAAAERELLHARRLAPRHATALQWHGVFLAAMGRLDEALAALEQARAQDPLSLSINETLGWALYCARRYDDAIARLRKTLELDPGFAPARKSLALACVQKSLFAEARRALAGAAPAAAELASARAVVLAASGDRAAAHAILKDLERRAQRSYVSPYLIGVAHAALAEHDQAFAWLERALAERSVNLLFLRVDPLHDTLRDDARFEALAQRVGLPEAASARRRSLSTPRPGRSAGS